MKEWRNWVKQKWREGGEERLAGWWRETALPPMEMSCQAWLIPSPTNWHLRYPPRKPVKELVLGTGEVKGKSQTPPRPRKPPKSSFVLTFPGVGWAPRERCDTFFSPALNGSSGWGFLEN